MKTKNDMICERTKGIIGDIIGAAEKHAERQAMVIEDRTYTYRELFWNVWNICRVLEETEETTIGIVSGNNPETYASILAVLISGKTYVILPDEFPAERNAQTIRKAGIRVILCGKTRHFPFAGTTGAAVIYTGPYQDTPEGFPELQPISTSVPAYIIFTSGSTGEPKGVPISRDNLNAFYIAYSSLGWNLGCNDRMLQMFQLTFDVSVVSFLFPLTLGACVCTVSQSGMKYLNVIDTMESHGITFAAVAPSVLRMVRTYFSELRFPELKYLVVTAEASDPELLEDFRKCIPNASIINLYGPTESTIYCTSYTVPHNGCKHHNGMVAIGREFPGMTAVIADSNGMEVPCGTAGELLLSGPQIMSGYWNDPEKTEAAMLHRNDGRIFYRTGDICFRDRDGDLIYCGRMDNQVKVQGYRIELSEIEYRARMFFGNSCNTAAFAIAGKDGNTELHLAVETGSGCLDGLEEYLKEFLPWYMVPKRIHFIPHFPANASNKTDRPEIMNTIRKIEGYDRQ